MLPRALKRQSTNHVTHLAANGSLVEALCCDKDPIGQIRFFQVGKQGALVESHRVWVPFVEILSFFTGSHMAAHSLP